MMFTTDTIIFTTEKIMFTTTDTTDLYLVFLINND